MTYEGFEKAKNQTHSYQRRGLFVVKVRASNDDGTTQATLTVLVEGMSQTGWITETCRQVDRLEHRHVDRRTGWNTETCRQANRLEYRDM